MHTLQQKGPLSSLSHKTCIYMDSTFGFDFWPVADTTWTFAKHQFFAFNLWNNNLFVHVACLFHVIGCGTAERFVHNFWRPNWNLWRLQSWDNWRRIHGGVRTAPAKWREGTETMFFRPRGWRRRDLTEWPRRPFCCFGHGRHCHGHCTGTPPQPKTPSHHPQINQMLLMRWSADSEGLDVDQRPCCFLTNADSCHITKNLPKGVT